MTVTPELLLFLAEKMKVAVEMRGSFVCLAHGGKGYAPHKDPAQFGRLVVWAWLNGLEVHNCADRMDAFGKRDGVPWWFNCYYLQYL